MHSGNAMKPGRSWTWIMKLLVVGSKVKGEPVAQRQEMVFSSLALLRGLSRVAFYASRAQGESVRLYILT